MRKSAQIITIKPHYTTVNEQGTSLDQNCKGKWRLTFDYKHVCLVRRALSLILFLKINYINYKTVLFKGIKTTKHFPFYSNATCIL